MKIKNRFVSLLSAAVMALTAMCVLSGGVSADEEFELMQRSAPNPDQKVTIECKREDEPLVGMEWNIYHVADIASDNSYKITDEFKPYNVAINNVSTSQLTAAAETLEAYAYIDDIKPKIHERVDTEGKIELTGIGYGMYLLSGTPAVINDNYYVPIASFLVLDEEADKYNGLQYNYNITAVPKMKVLAATNRIYSRNVTAKIRWENDNEETRPKSVDVTLTRDGNSFKNAVLSDENAWTCTWKNCSSKYLWKVIEDEVPAGYTVTIQEKEINVDPKDENSYDLEFIITNRGDYTPVVPDEPGIITPAPTSPSPSPLPSPPADPAPAPVTVAGPVTLPQTGQLWWPVPMLSAAGMVIFITGWAVNSIKRKRNEK